MDFIRSSFCLYGGAPFRNFAWPAALRPVAVAASGSFQALYAPRVIDSV